MVDVDTIQELSSVKSSWDASVVDSKASVTNSEWIESLNVDLLSFLILVTGDIDSLIGLDDTDVFLTKEKGDGNRLSIIGSNWLHWMSLETILHGPLESVLDTLDDVLDVGSEGLDDASMLIVSVVHRNGDSVEVSLLSLLDKNWGIWQDLGDGSERSGSDNVSSLNVDGDSLWNNNSLFCEDGFSHFLDL